MRGSDVSMIRRACLEMSNNKQEGHSEVDRVASLALKASMISSVRVPVAQGAEVEIHSVIFSRNSKSSLEVVVLASKEAPLAELNNKLRVKTLL